MGCFQSKNKSKARPLKFERLDQNACVNRWKRSLSIQRLFVTIVSNSNGVAEHPAYYSIQKDISRTFPNEKYFKDPSNITTFREVLRCFALTFPKIGYTQGLNFLAGYFLLNKTETVMCVKFLVQICTHPQLMCLGFYEDNFPLVQLYCRLFWKLLQKIDPNLYLYIKQLEMPDNMWIFKWYITFFLYSFPIEYVPYFYNYIFQHKGFALVKLSIGIVLSLREDIMNLGQKDQCGFTQFLSNLQNFQSCQKALKIEDILYRSSQIPERLVQQSLALIGSQGQIKNFYVKYFCGDHDQKKTLYDLFLNEIEEKKVELSNSKHDSNLMQSFKRNQQKVQILDEILIESIKRHKNKKYKSSMDAKGAESRIYKKSQPFKGWKSQAFIEQDIKNENETTVSIVQKVHLQDDK